MVKIYLYFNMIIKHSECNLIYLKNDKIVLLKEIDILDVKVFKKIKKELDFFEQIRSKYDMHKFMKIDKNFLFYHEDLRSYMKELIDPLGYIETNLEEFYDVSYKSLPCHGKYTYMQLNNIFNVFKKFGVIKNNKIVKLTKDLIEPEIKD